MRTLTTREVTQINRELVLAKIGASRKAKPHIDKALEIINGTHIKK